MTQHPQENINKLQSFMLEFVFGGVSAFISKTAASPI